MKSPRLTMPTALFRSSIRLTVLVTVSLMLPTISCHPHTSRVVKHPTTITPHVQYPTPTSISKPIPLPASSVVADPPAMEDVKSEQDDEEYPQDLPLVVQNDGASSSRRRPNEEWFHPADHPVTKLFEKRQTGSNATETFPAVGSQEWRSLFPTAPFTDKTHIPQAWLDALNKAKAAGLIPNLPVAKATSGDPLYPNGTNPYGGDICSSTYRCRHPDDLWDAPAGRLGISFDDGPLPASPELYKFLRQNNQTATHFFIGSNILANPYIFLEAFQENHDDIAVHTYTHQALTTITDEMIVAELGWTLEIIRVSTGGRISRYYRPPYGDVDNRVRAIARQVFGLTTVIWNKDTLDWGLPNKPTTAGVSYNYTLWLTGPKSPGLLILSHELSKDTVTAFMDHYHLVRENGWDARSIPDLFGGGWYVNAKNSTSPVTPGIQVGQDSGKPVWDGFQAESMSLGSSTHLTFSSTASPGSSTASATSATAVQNTRASPNGASSGRSWFVSLAVGCLILSTFGAYGL